MRTFNRRDFIRFSAMGVGTVVLSSGLMGCDSDNDSVQNNGATVAFEHGVASGDPTASSIILWTRATPSKETELKVDWEIATDINFENVVHNGTTTTSIERDYTVKLDAVDLGEGREYFYRFRSSNTYSPVGRAKTLPVEDVNSLKLAVMSCANYPAGYFHAYEDAAKDTEIDAVVHLGDYIYEYGMDGYATQDAESLNRVVNPTHEIISLDDYRARYAQYRGDTGLQALHAHAPFICVWDDHEITNDTWRDGAENHNDGEGDFNARKAAALQAYFEWLPIRPVGDENFSDTIYRSFEFGDLVSLHMLDTRVVARDEQLNYANYIDPTTGAFDSASFSADVTDTNRALLGAEQLTWLQDQLITSNARWQVLGQQILMGTMTLPAAIVTQQMSIPQFAELGALAVLAGRAQANDPTLTDQEMAYLAANQARLTPQVLAQLQLPAIPYNLDAWDGYAYEREVIFNTAKQEESNLVVLAGDTHNAWASDLLASDGSNIGVEFATSSVTSPGLESYLGVAPEDMAATEAGIVGLIDNLKYLDMSQRGYLVVTFTRNNVSAEWRFVSDVKATSYTTSRYQRSVELAPEGIRIAQA